MTKEAVKTRIKDIIGHMERSYSISGDKDDVEKIVITAIDEAIKDLPEYEKEIEEMREEINNNFNKTGDLKDLEEIIDVAIKHLLEKV